MAFYQPNIPSERATLSRTLTSIPPNTLAYTAKIPANTAKMAGGVLNIACYITNIAYYIVQTVARTAIMAGGDKNIACDTFNIASRTINIDNYIASDDRGLTRNAANISRTSPDTCNAIHHTKKARKAHIKHYYLKSAINC